MVFVAHLTCPFGNSTIGSAKPHDILIICITFEILCGGISLAALNLVNLGSNTAENGILTLEALVLKFKTLLFILKLLHPGAALDVDLVSFCTLLISFSSGFVSFRPILSGFCVQLLLLFKPVHLIEFELPSQIFTLIRMLLPFFLVSTLDFIGFVLHVPFDEFLAGFHKSALGKFLILILHLDSFDLGAKLFVR